MPAARSCVVVIGQLVVSREGAPTAASSVPQPPPASASEASTSSQGPEPAKKKKGMFGNPTPVLLLKNMVAPGDVDDELSHETKIVSFSVFCPIVSVSFLLRC